MYRFLYEVRCALIWTKGEEFRGWFGEIRASLEEFSALKIEWENEEEMSLKFDLCIKETLFTGKRSPQAFLLPLPRKCLKYLLLQRKVNTKYSLIKAEVVLKVLQIR